MAAAIPALSLAVAAAGTGYSVYAGERAQEMASKEAKKQRLQAEAAEKQLKEKEMRETAATAEAAARARSNAQKATPTYNPFGAASDPYRSTILGSASARKTLIGG